jgi:Tfp pilus assembly protein PilF
MFSAPTRGTSLALPVWPNSPKTLHVRQPNSYSELVRIMSIRPVALAVLMTVASALPAQADARSDAKAQVAFGISVAQRGLWREAIYRWEKAVEIDPTYAAAFNDLAIAYEHEGQLEKARKAYERAVELDPNNAEIRQNHELFKEINDRTSSAKDKN